MMTFLAPGKPRVVVDYAHSPDALEKALTALREHVRGRLICVFGCGGDRDAGKRPLMAAAVSGCADAAVVTNDNPRGEDPAAIADSICGGFVPGFSFEVELERSAAIRRGLELAGAQGMVLVAGKGHEDYQEIAGRRIAYSDAEAVKQALGI